jgi:hypothetical protein
VAGSQVVVAALVAVAAVAVGDRCPTALIKVHRQYL